MRKLARDTMPKTQDEDSFEAKLPPEPAPATYTMQPDGSWYPGFPLPDWIRFGRKGRMARPGAGDTGNCYAFNSKAGCRYGDACWYAHNYNYKMVTAYGLYLVCDFWLKWVQACYIVGLNLAQYSFTIRLNLA